MSFYILYNGYEIRCYDRARRFTVVQYGYSYGHGFGNGQYKYTEEYMTIEAAMRSIDYAIAKTKQ